MKSLLLILSVFLTLGFSLKAEEQIRERVFVHTDKNCYIAGENMLLKFYVVNRNFQPSELSKVGYVEICNTEKPQMQLKVALEKGSGAGQIRIPMNIPSGIYQLTGYTRYMRNEGRNTFFKKQIAIVNAGLQTFPDPKRMELVKNIQSLAKEPYNQKAPADLLVKTDQNEYGNRKKVLLSLAHIPANTPDLIISVSRNDSIAFLPEVNEQDWLKQVTDTFHISQQWLPEYEGHIIEGRIVPKPQEQQLQSSVAVVGKDMRYFSGQINAQKDKVSYYTSGIFGNQQVVTTVVSSFYEKVPYRVDLLSPFDETLPDSLPVLPIYPNKKQLLERYVAAQIQQKRDSDFFDYSIQPPNYCTLQPISDYDLDQYTRFSSIGETILEFILRVHVNKVGGNREIHVYLADEQRFSLRTLVLLDGIPIYTHEDIFGYNPMYLKRITVYDGRYTFGKEEFEGIVSFTTREANLPSFQLGGGSQLFNYEYPQLPLSTKVFDYSDNIIKNSKKPDFRHTLYWNPFVEYKDGQPVNLSFYTSDLCGEFKVNVEGITKDGKIIHGTSYFQVK